MTVDDNTVVAAREHVNENGEFQSDKYLWCKSGFVPLKLTDPAAREVLLRYADLREPIDADFSADLRFCIFAAGGAVDEIKRLREALFAAQDRAAGELDYEGAAMIRDILDNKKAKTI